MRSDPRIPPRNTPDDRRFGTDPDERPPMRPADAILAIVLTALSCLLAISLAAGTAEFVAQINAAAAQAVAEEDAKRNAPEGNGAAK